MKALVKYDIKYGLIIQTFIKCMARNIYELKMLIDWVIILTAGLKVDSKLLWVVSRCKIT